jgi:hypothetical protein
MKKNRMLSLVCLLLSGLSLYACSSSNDSPPVVFYEKEVKSVPDLSKEEYREDYREIRRSMEEHLRRKPPLVSLEGVSERDLISVCVDTGYSFQSLLDRLRKEGPLQVLRQRTNEAVIDTPIWQIQFKQDINGYAATFVLDKEKGIQISPKQFFVLLGQTKG